MIAKLEKFKKSKLRLLVLTSLFFSILILFTPFVAQAIHGSYTPQPGSSQKSHISDSLSDPTDTTNVSPHGNGLPEVEGISWFKESKPTDISGLEARINQDKEAIQRIITVQEQLEVERKKAFQKSTAWKIKEFGSFVWNLGNEDPNSVAYNTKRLKIIDAMITNADLKLKFLQNDMATCAFRISNIRLTEAEKTGDKATVVQAQKESDEKLKEVQETRKNATNKLAEIKANHDAPTCFSFNSGLNLEVCLLQATGWVANTITWVFALLLWVSSKIFDLSVYMSISLIGNWLNMGGAVADVWKILRDLANLCFVFVLLYIAIGTVFELSGMGDPKKMIVSVVVIALLVNFSGFFTRVIIDSSNVIAYEFYSQMGGGGLGVGTIGTKLVQKMNLGAYFIKASAPETAASAAGSHYAPPVVERLSFMGIIGQMFGNIIIILVTSFVLLTASILFLIRTIYLLFLYIFSPIAFVSKIIPSSKFNFFDDWLNRLIKQSFFAPAFLVPLYVVFVLLDQDGGIVSLVGGTRSILALPMVNIIIVGLLLSCIFVANKMGAAGAKFATGVAGGATLLGAKGITRGLGGAGRFAGKYTGQAATRASAWANRTSMGIGPGGTAVPPSIRNNLSRIVAGGVIGAGRVTGGVAGGAKYAWNSAPGKAFQKSEAGKKIIGAVKNPLLATSEGIVKLEQAIRSPGAGSYSFFGKTSAERKDAKKKEDEDKKEAKKKEIKDKGDRLRTVNEVDAGTILGTMTDSDIKELPLDVLARDEVSRNLTHSNLDALQKAGNIPNAQRRAMQTAITRGPATPGLGYMLGPSGAFWG